MRLLPDSNHAHPRAGNPYAHDTDSEHEEAHRDEILRYVRALRRVGYVRQVGETRDPLDTGARTRIAPVYELVVDTGPHAPRARTDGTVWDPNLKVAVAQVM